MFGSFAPRNISLSAGTLQSQKPEEKHFAWLKLHFQLAINTENRAAECSAVISYGTMVLVLQNTTQELRQLLKKPQGTWCSKQGIKGIFILKQGIEETRTKLTSVP